MAENMYSNFDNVIVAISKESTTDGGWADTTGQDNRYPLYMIVDRIKPDRKANTKVQKWMGAGRDPNTVWSGAELFEIKLEGALVFDHNFGTTPCLTTGPYSTRGDSGYANFISLLGAAMGTVSSTGVCVLRDTLDSFTLEWGNDPQMRDQALPPTLNPNEYYNNGTPIYYLAEGCRINTYEATLNKEGSLKVSLSIMAKEISTSPTAQTMSGNSLEDLFLPNIRPLDFWDGHPSSTPFQITFGDGDTYNTKVGADPEIEEISFKINNNLEPKHSLGTSKYISSLNPRGREITCSLKVVKRSEHLQNVYNAAFDSNLEQDFNHAQTHLDSIRMLLYHQDLSNINGGWVPMMFVQFNNLIPTDYSDNMGELNDDQIVENFTFTAFRTGDSRFLHSGHPSDLEPIQARIAGTTTFSGFVSNPGYP